MSEETKRGPSLFLYHKTFSNGYQMAHVTPVENLSKNDLEILKDTEKHWDHLEDVLYDHSGNLKEHWKDLQQFTDISKYFGGYAWIATENIVSV